MHAFKDIRDIYVFHLANIVLLPFFQNGSSPGNRRVAEFQPLGFVTLLLMESVESNSLPVTQRSV